MPHAPPREISGLSTQVKERYQELKRSPFLGPKLTEEDFKDWLKSIERDGDGHISRKELREALKALGMRNTRWKAWRAMVHADLNKDKSIEGDSEVDELIKYAQKRWGFVFSKDSLIR